MPEESDNEPYKPPRAKIADGVRVMTPTEQKAYNKYRARKDAKAAKLLKRYGKTEGQLVKEDVAKIRAGKKTGRRLHGQSDGTGGSPDGHAERNKDIVKMKQRSQSGGKGDAPRSCFSKQFRDNYDGIFGKRKIKGRKEGKITKKYK